MTRPRLLAVRSARRRAAGGHFVPPANLPAVPPLPNAGPSRRAGSGSSLLR